MRRSHRPLLCSTALSLTALACSVGMIGMIGGIGCTGGTPAASESASAPEISATPESAPAAAASTDTDTAAPTDADAGEGGEDGSEPAVEPAAPPDDLIDWVAFEGGSFEMRSDLDDSTHPTDVAPFEIARTEVTQAQYAACVEAGACPPADPGGCADDEAQRAKLVDPALPMVCVNWDEARAFARWVGGDLPSEAQWAWAARSGGQDRAFPWGDQKATCVRAVMNWGCAPGHEGAVMRPPCSKPKGNSAQGVCDLAGNVSEWMGEIADFDPDTRARGTKINRGGSWHGMDGPHYKAEPRPPSGLRVAHRSRYPASMRSNSLGFRPARAR